jgi:hypothetical protein
VDIENPFAFSMCSAIRENEDWRLGAENSVKYEVLNTATDEEREAHMISLALFRPFFFPKPLDKRDPF